MPIKDQEYLSGSIRSGIARIVAGLGPSGNLRMFLLAYCVSRNQTRDTILATLGKDSLLLAFRSCFLDDGFCAQAMFAVCSFFNI